MYHMLMQDGAGLTVWGVMVDTPAVGARNTDGIDPLGETDVTLNDDMIQDGDDCVAIKSAYPVPASNITVENVHCYGTHGLSIGSQTGGNVTNVLHPLVRVPRLRLPARHGRQRQVTGTPGERLSGRAARSRAARRSTNGTACCGQTCRRSAMPLFRKVDALTVPVPDLGAGLRFYRQAAAAVLAAGGRMVTEPSKGRYVTDGSGNVTGVGS